MSKEETPPIIRWLHRYIFRGLGVLGSGALASHFVTATFLPGESALAARSLSTERRLKEKKCQLPTNEKSSRLYFS